MNVFTEFFIQIDTSTRKVKPNDWNDLINLIYVGPDDLYWTKEKRWNIIFKDAKMERYLFKG